MTKVYQYLVTGLHPYLNNTVTKNIVVPVITITNSVIITNSLDLRVVFMGL